MNDKIQSRGPLAISNAVQASLIPALAGIAFIALILLVLGSPNRYIYDEPYYLEGAFLLAKGMRFTDFLLAPLNTPAGPLFPTVQWCLSPLTHFQAQLIRLPNIVFLGMAITANAYSLSCWGYKDAWSRATMLLALSIMWVSAGMALTEMPAFAFASFAVAAAAWGMSDPQALRRRIWAGFAISGLCFGIAILGRQPYLPAAGGLVMVAVFEPRFRWPAAFGAALAILVPLPVFLVWGGLVAPHVARVGGLSLTHGALAYAYLSALMVILAPTFFLTRWRWTLGIGLVVGLAAMPLGGMGATVAPGVAGHLPPALQPLFQLGISVAMIGGGAAVIVASGINIWSRRDDRIFVLMVLLMLGMTFTAAGIIHLFSSRYLMAAFPFALFAAQPFFTPSRWAIARFAAGAVFGYLTLAHYFAL